MKIYELSTSAKLSALIAQWKIRAARLGLVSRVFERLRGAFAVEGWAAWRPTRRDRRPRCATWGLRADASTKYPKTPTVPGWKILFGCNRVIIRVDNPVYIRA